MSMLRYGTLCYQDQGDCKASALLLRRARLPVSGLLVGRPVNCYCQKSVSRSFDANVETTHRAESVQGSFGVGCSGDHRRRAVFLRIRIVMRRGGG